MVFAKKLLEGKRILVTGASSGIGRRFAIQSSILGADVILIGRNEERLHITLNQLAPGNHQLVCASLESVDKIKSDVKNIAKASGPFHSVFHCAGQYQVSRLKQSSDKCRKYVFDASVNGAIALSSLGMDDAVFLEGSSIVLMGSAAGHRGQQGLVLYGAAKAAVDGIVRGACVELSPRRVTINSIVAGTVKTEMFDRATNWMNSSALADFEKTHPLGFGIEDDVSNAAVFLISSAGCWITGTSMIVDGGLLAQ